MEDPPIAQDQRPIYQNQSSGYLQFRELNQGIIIRNTETPFINEINVETKKYRVVDIKKTAQKKRKKNEMILDIGPKTIQLYAKYIKKAQTLVWNGAMGYFEQSPYHIGTHSIARVFGSVANGKAYGVIGGGETILAVEQVGMSEHMDHICTGGGAMLEYLAGNELPGLNVLEI